MNEPHHDHPNHENDQEEKSGKTDVNEGDPALGETTGTEQAADNRENDPPA